MFLEESEIEREPFPSEWSQPWETEAMVTAVIRPGRAGQVKFQGSWWSARCLQAIAIPRGAIVRVVGLHSITLIVEPLPS